MSQNSITTTCNRRWFKFAIALSGLPIAGYFAFCRVRQWFTRFSNRCCELHLGDIDVNVHSRVLQILGHAKRHPETPLKLIIDNSPGGAYYSLDKLCAALRTVPAGYVTFVNGEALSCATILCLGSKELVMVPGYSVLSNFDPIIETKFIYPLNLSSYQVRVLNEIANLDNNNKNLAKWPRQMKFTFTERYLHVFQPLVSSYTENIIRKHLTKDVQDKVLSKMFFALSVHETHYFYQDLKDMGLENVRLPTADEHRFFDCLK